MSANIPMSWEIAKGGRSVNVGSHGKIRMEPGLPSETIQACMLLTSAAPDMYNAIKEYLDWGPMTASDRELHATAFRAAIAKAEQA